jgi:hypothetical protein
MKLIDCILNESIHPKTREAKSILVASGMPEKDANSLALKIEDGDPYKDAGKLFTPVIANWLANKSMMTYDEHLHDIEKYKENRKLLTSKKVAIVNLNKKRDLLSKKPEDFMRHYSHLQEWNTQCELLFDDGKSDNSAKEIEFSKHNGYTMYKIDKEEHLDIPLVKNKMRWCVTKRHFGKYSGPPYYAIMKDSDNSQFAMIIPNHFNEDPDQAVRSADNRNRLSPSDMRKVRPLIQMVLDPKKHTHPYINAIYDIKAKPPINPTPKDAIKYIKDNAIELDKWKEGEDVIAKDPWVSLDYASYLGPGIKFEKGEGAIAKHANESLRYARHLGPGKMFEEGEGAISKIKSTSLEYAKHLGSGKRFEKGEDAIAKDPWVSLEYVKHIKSRFKLGEKVIHGYGNWKEYKSFLKWIGIEPPDKPWEPGDPE